VPVVVISQYVYVATNKEALKLAKRSRLGGKRSEIISDREYSNRRLKLAEIQDLDYWAKHNSISSI
jgi:hypothetical protein